MPGDKTVELQHWGNIQAQVKSFMGKTHRVMMDGEVSTWVPVESGVPQGMVLWPVLFLTFINDLPKATSSRVRLFTDDCMLYRRVKLMLATRSSRMIYIVSKNEKDSGVCHSPPAQCSSIAITRNRKICFNNIPSTTRYWCMSIVLHTLMLSK